MNIYITVDMEGISGVYEPAQMREGVRYEEARRYLTWDINACAEGCKAAGANKIIVRDSHAGGSNIIWSELSPHIDRIVTGRSAPDKRMPHFEECDAVILLGYHAMAGTSGGVLEHTMSSAAWQNFWINGKLAGEIAIEACIAGENDKPIIMVSGDDYACAEARALLPNVVTAEVKQGLSVAGASMLVREKAHALIRAKAEEAVKNASQMKPYKVETPVKLRLELIERGQVPSSYSKPYMEIIDGRTYEVTANSVEEGLFRLN